MQNDGLKDIGNKANNALILATVLIGLGFTIFSINSSSGSTNNNTTIYLGFSAFIFSIMASLIVMYGVALRSLPRINKLNVFECISNTESDEITEIGVLLNQIRANEATIGIVKYSSLASYIFMLTGIILEFRYLSLVL